MEAITVRQAQRRHLARTRQSLCRALLSSSLLLACLGLSVYAQIPGLNGQQAAEAQIKAAMVYRFLGYTHWPEAAFPSEDSPYRIWVLDANPVAQELQAIANARRANDRPIEVFETNSVTQISDPHVVFVGRDAERHLQRLEQFTNGHATLVVTESEQGLDRGSIINLRLVDGRIGFDVSLADAQKSNLQISSRLLPLAISVEQ